MEFVPWDSGLCISTEELDDARAFIDSQDSIMSTQKHHDKIWLQRNHELMSEIDPIYVQDSQPVNDYDDELFVASTPPWEEPLPEEPVEDLRVRLGDRTPEKTLDYIEDEIKRLERRAITLIRQIDNEVCKPARSLRFEAEIILANLRAAEGWSSTPDS